MPFSLIFKWYQCYGVFETLFSSGKNKSSNIGDRAYVNFDIKHKQILMVHYTANKKTAKY